MLSTLTYIAPNHYCYIQNNTIRVEHNNETYGQDIQLWRSQNDKTRIVLYRYIIAICEEPLELFGYSSAY